MTVLKQVRRSRGISQEGLATVSGVSRSAIQYAERTGSMSVPTAKKLARHLGVDWPIFFADDASKTKQGRKRDRPA
jgi:transcriptional regulator with XRE-family HTH domain